MRYKSIITQWYKGSWLSSRQRVCFITSFLAHSPTIQLSLFVHSIGQAGSVPRSPVRCTLGNKYFRYFFFILLLFFNYK
jgi:hypothetical protein